MPASHVNTSSIVNYLDATPLRPHCVPNPGSSVAVLALADGRWILVFNDTERGRHRMALAVSPDEGKSWRHERYLDQAEEGGSGFGYPSAIHGTGLFTSPTRQGFPDRAPPSSTWRLIRTTSAQAIPCSPREFPIKTCLNPPPAASHSWHGQPIQPGSVVDRAVAGRRAFHLQHLVPLGRTPEKLSHDPARALRGHCGY
jgi:hypothetical protein